MRSEIGDRTVGQPVMGMAPMIFIILERIVLDVHVVVSFLARRTAPEGTRDREQCSAIAMMRPAFMFDLACQCLPTIYASIVAARQARGQARWRRDANGTTASSICGRP